jgi:AraC-like DNA-binding protein
LVEARLEMASQFLTDARMSIAHIAQVLGYSEISAFTRFFTTARGMSPAEYRRCHSDAARSPAKHPRGLQRDLDEAAE